MSKKPGELAPDAASPNRPGLAGESLPPDTSPCSDSLGAIIRADKSAVTLRWRFSGAAEEMPLWQCYYYEHIIRDEDDLDSIRHYIIKNPLRWVEDVENIKDTQGSKGLDGQ
ncbi:MAG: hypothetical protein AB9891_06865 [Anaerolineaceae bacterium]